MKVLFKVDTDNGNQVISKDQDITIKAGSELDVELTENIQRLIDLGIVETVEKVEATTKPEKKAAPKKPAAKR